jgi:tRNA C32,U32 (ribose-2'-O)-methylase TrmJ
MTNETQVATKARLETFLAHLTAELDACGFLRNQPKRPGMVRNIRHLFQRGEVTEQELRTLHGIVTELSIGRRQRGRVEEEVGEAVHPAPPDGGQEKAPGGCSG